MAQRSEKTRARMVEAALETLKSEGFAGTSARAIAQRGNFNQALIFYHYGGVNELLLAALDASAAERISSYRDAIERAGSAAELIDELGELYANDVRSGHVTVLSELFAASLADPELGPLLLERMRPWLELTRDAFERVLAESPLRELVPVREASFALVALYLGLNLLTRIDPEGADVESVLALMRQVAPLITPG